MLSAGWMVNRYRRQILVYDISLPPCDSDVRLATHETCHFVRHAHNTGPGEPHPIRHEPVATPRSTHPWRPLAPHGERHPSQPRTHAGHRQGSPSTPKWTCTKSTRAANRHESLRRSGNVSGAERRPENPSVPLYRPCCHPCKHAYDEPLKGSLETDGWKPSLGYLTFAHFRL